MEEILILVCLLLTEPEQLLALTANSPSICILVEQGAGTGARMIVANHAGGAIATGPPMKVTTTCSLPHQTMTLSVKFPFQCHNVCTRGTSNKSPRICCCQCHRSTPHSAENVPAMLHWTIRFSPRASGAKLVWQTTLESSEAVHHSRQSGRSFFIPGRHCRLWCTIECVVAVRVRAGRILAGRCSVTYPGTTSY